MAKPQINKRSDGFVQVRINTGMRDDNGKIIYKSFHGKTKKEAQDKADEYKLEIATYGSTLDKTTTTSTSTLLSYAILGFLPHASLLYVLVPSKELTILYSGMRVGEAIALKGNRVIPIPKFLTTELKKYQLATPKNTEGLVF